MTQNAIIFILFVIAVVLVAVVVMLAISRTQEKNMRRSLALTLANQGNARSRYELWADDPAHVLQFDFLLDGVSLSHSAAASAQPAGQNLLTTPPIRPQARANGSSGPSVTQAAAKASGAAQSANGFANFIGEILDTLGNILPGSAGQSILNVGANIRRGQASVQRVQRVEQRAEGVGEQFQGYAARVQGATASTRSPAANSVSSAPTASGAMADVPVTPAHPQTPYVEPGSQVELGLRVAPLMRLKEDRVVFTISSRSLEEPGAQPVTQPGTVNFPGMTGIRFYLPYIIVGGVALLLILLLMFATHVLG
jgi:hypothetical protein